MRSSALRLFILACAILALPVMAHAQEAVLTGTVTDSTGAVLPGTTVTATHEASGNTFQAVTDERGAYRIPVRVGVYRMAAELQGFTTVTRTGVELLVGQTLTLNLQMALSGVAENVTVTGETPLIETTQSSIGGNIDPRQVSDLPVNGRNWMSLALLAPGNRTNAQGALPVQDRGDVREFQINVDGLQVTANLGTGNQSRYSRDSIAEFQFISNRFDATQGRSSGVQVNAVTKSGTNRPTGSFTANFRDSKWNSDDPVLNRVIPYSNQQISTTFGGPIVQNRLHFFGNFEYEREPRTSIWNTPYPKFNVELEGTRNVKMGGVRLDYELSPKMRLMGKAGQSTLWEPFGAGNVNHPAATNSNREYSTDVIVQLTQVLNNRALNEVRAGYAAYGIKQDSLVSWSRHWLAPQVATGSPRITFSGFTVAGNSNLPRYRYQSVYTLHDDFTFSYDAAGRHDMKAGGEWLYLNDMTRNCNRCMGVIDARGGPVPANIEALLPDPFNADTWNLAAISSITRRYTVGVSDSAFRTPLPMHKYGAWVQDDWKAASNLTLNLGLRYDLIWDSFAQFVDLPPFMTGGRPQDANNVQPRAGFAYTLNDRTVLRGGAGLYYNDVLNTNVLWPVSPLSIAVIAATYDGRSDFAANPFNGPLPSYSQALQRFCYVRNVPGCLLRDAQELAPIEDYSHVTHSWQSSIGMARQFGTDMAIEADYVYTGSRDEKSIQDNINLGFNPATGVNYPYSDRSKLPYPEWGVVGMIPHTGWSNYHGLQSVFTKRMSNRWQASITYTLSALRDADPLPLSGLREVTFKVAPDLGGEYTLADSDQRHRAVFNGIWQVGHGLQLSGIYFYGSGLRMATSAGCECRGLGVTGSDRLRRDGTIIPRNSFVGDPLHRVDLRLLQRVPLGPRVGLEGFLEVFNLFDRSNFGSYTLDESSRQYGQPAQNTNLSYAARSLQLGFRATF